jgi:hypothetical protein
LRVRLFLHAAAEAVVKYFIVSPLQVWRYLIALTIGLLLTSVHRGRAAIVDVTFETGAWDLFQAQKGRPTCR